MIKIGEFAKLCGVDAQTLRYYDKIGVLCADHIDESSGYRYYKKEKLERLQLILDLKELNFSLDEIKRFFLASPEEQKALCFQKKRALEQNIQASEEKIQRINSYFDTEKSALAFLDLPFEDDPDVIGKWEFCGVLPLNSIFSSENELQKKEVLLKTIYFLPGGGHVWNYFWTKGILYRLRSNGKCVSQRYSVCLLGEKRYLLLEALDGELEQNKQYVYRQIDCCTYTEEETYIYKDHVDLPFVPDRAVLGIWEAFDLVESPCAVSESPTVKDDARFFVKKIAFFERGVCYKLLKNTGEGQRKICAYTSGMVLDREMHFAERYEICTKNGEDYLILEHKSGDYAYLGKVFCYYVFKRKKLEGRKA